MGDVYIQRQFKLLILAKEERQAWAMTRADKMADNMWGRVEKQGGIENNESFNHWL